MAWLFCALGHVLHLNQDLSAPDHVRNDNHGSHRSFEPFGSGEFVKNALEPAFSEQRHGWAYWQGQGFSKLLDFWDRGKFMNSSSLGLDNDAQGKAGEKLGLAEFSNGNFLGEDTLYAEYFKPGNKHYFPFPSLKDTDQPQLKPGRLLGTLDTVTLLNGKQGKRPFLRKVGAGIPVIHHSALHYLAVLNSPKMGGPSMRASLTINDPNVLGEYHSILIPKAIEYSAGILDYFFRGRFETLCYGATADGRNQLRITNKSGQSLRGGTFQLFYDDSTGTTRTELRGDDFRIPDWTSCSILPDDASLDVTFRVPPCVDVSRYTLVYRGTIGIAADGQALDPVDEDIAIATAQVFPCPANCGTGQEVARVDCTTPIPSPLPSSPPYPVPEPTFSENGTVFLGPPAAQEFIGFKNVQAQKSWHGHRGFTANDGCNGPILTRYLQLERKATLKGNYWESTGDPANPFVECEYSYTIRRVYAVDRYSGIITEVAAENPGGVESPPVPFPCGDGCGPTIDPEWLWGIVRGGDYSCGQWRDAFADSSGYFSTVFLIPSTRGVKTLQPATDSGLHAFARYDGTECGEDHPVWQEFEFWYNLSIPYTASAVQADIETLLGQWDMGNDALYPWRTDEFCTVGPLVTYNESPGGVDPDMWASAGWVDPHSPSAPDAVEKWDGTKRGKPLPAGHQGTVNLAQLVESWNPYGGWSTWGYGEQVPGYLPGNATQWTPKSMAANVVLPCAFVAVDASGRFTAQKWAETKLSRKSYNYFRPCGADRWLVDEETVRCVTGMQGNAVTVSGDDPQWSVGDKVLLEYTGESGVYPIASAAYPNYTLGAKISDLPIWYLYENSTIGRLRFWDIAWPICGRIRVTDASNTFPIRITLANITALITGDSIVVSEVTGNTAANGTWTVTRIDDTHFELQGSLGNGAFTCAGWAASLNAPEYTWNDDSPKGDVVALTAQFNGRQGVADVNNCATIWAKDPCAVLYFSPNAETFQNGYPAGTWGHISGGQDVCDEGGDERWCGEIKQFVPDPLWQPPQRPCNWDEILQIDPTATWVEDVQGDCSGRYAHRPLVEARCEVPDHAPGWPNDDAPHLPTGISLQCMGGECWPPPYPLGPMPPDGVPECSTEWGLWLRQRGCVCAHGSFEEAYKANGVH